MVFHVMFWYLRLFLRGQSCIIKTDSDGSPAVHSIILNDSRGLPFMASLG